MDYNNATQYGFWVSLHGIKANEQDLADLEKILKRILRRKRKGIKQIQTIHKPEYNREDLLTFEDYYAYEGTLGVKGWLEEK